ncbi:MAG: hypothetical protein Q7V19_07385, partial [Bacteroidales bacterium]|nr:hypothetical protein [Bacteroidales bacterium]
LDDISLEITNPNPVMIEERVLQNFSFQPVKNESEDEKLEMERKSLERQARLKAMSLKIRTNEGIEELEKQPAYLRKGSDMKSEQNEMEISRYSLGGDIGRTTLRSDNSFLHDNVD